MIVTDTFRLEKSGHHHVSNFECCTVQYGTGLYHTTWLLDGEILIKLSNVATDLRGVIALCIGKIIDSNFFCLLTNGLV